MQRGIATHLLGRILDHEMRPLNPVVGRDVASRSNRHWAAPCKPGLVDLRFELRHASRRRAFVDNARPLRNHIQEHGTLLLVHAGRLQTLGLDRLSILARAEHQVCQTETQNGLFLLVLVQCVEQRDRLVALRAERPYGFSVECIESGLGAGKRWRKNVTLADDRDIEGEMVPSELQQPGTLFGGRSENGEVIEIFTEHQAASAWPAVSAPATPATRRRPVGTFARRRTTAPSTVLRPVPRVALEHFVAIHNLLDLLETSWAER